MQQVDGRLIVSATDLVNHVECPHLTALNIEVAKGTSSEARPQRRDDASREVVVRRGLDHEKRHLDSLKESNTIAEIAEPDPSVGRVAGLEERERQTTEAMAQGVDVVFQATFLDRRDEVWWRGHADFLHRVDKPSDLGEFSYEPEDTKLARSVKAGAVLQLSHYAEQVERLQGAAPAEVHVALGDNSKETVRQRDVSAYYRSVRARFLTDLAAGHKTYPLPVGHCAVCNWNERCEQQRIDDDHLTLVAGLGTDQTRKLESVGIGTVAALAAHNPEHQIRGIGPGTITRLVRQARLQKQRVDGDPPPFVIAPDVEAGLGLATLPEPDPGDLFYDIEGDPFVGPNGLEYLHGIGWTDEQGNFAFETRWAHDAHEEKAAFEGLVDRIVEQRRHHPNMHVYHYAPYERTALGRLAATYATREDEIDQILRDDVLVDLYRIVRQGLIIGSPSYSLKKLEPLYMPARAGAITDAGSSIAEYERWLEEQDQQILDDIEAYNRDDVESTQLLRDWLIAVAEGTTAETGQLDDPGPGASHRPTTAEPRPHHVDKTVPSEKDDQARAKREAVEAEVAELTVPLLRGLQESFPPVDDEENGRWLLAQLLRWHQREARPEWWRYFDRLESTLEELYADTEAIAGLQMVGEPEIDKRSHVWTYEFDPDQEHKLGPGAKVEDPATKAAMLAGGPSVPTPGVLVWIDNAAGQLKLKRGITSKAPHPEALIPAGPINTDVLRDALRNLARTMEQHGADGDGPGTAALQLLARRPPRVIGVARGEALRREGESTVDAAVRLVSNLDRSYLPIQGPPGAGKTYTAAKAVVALARAGKTIGITANSHAVVCNLLRAVLKEAAEQGVTVRAIQKPGDGKDAVEHDDVELEKDNATIEARAEAGEVDIIAGTAWLFAREGMSGTLDTLVVDEAGQLSLANVCAVASTARNLVLVGDPMQLSQPSKGTHPAGAAASALEHALGGAATVPTHLGLFLDRTWRMHPEITEFISDQIYDGRLFSEDHTGQQRITTGPLQGSGLRWLPVTHMGNRTSSTEEAEAIAATYASLLGKTWVDRDGDQKTIGTADILFVAPYNAQVRTLVDHLPKGARVGTVDRFQGQEAAVVIVSLAASSADDVPRGMEFLFSRNRLNVAVSRAQAVCVMVSSPTLLEVRCRTVAQMKLANTLCRYVELAERFTPA